MDTVDLQLKLSCSHQWQTLMTLIEWSAHLSLYSCLLKCHTWGNLNLDPFGNSNRDSWMKLSSSAIETSKKKKIVKARVFRVEPSMLSQKFIPKLYTLVFRHYSWHGRSLEVTHELCTWGGVWVKRRRVSVIKLFTVCCNYAEMYVLAVNTNRKLWKSNIKYIRSRSILNA